MEKKKVKLVKVSDLRWVMDAHSRGEISFSRAAEMLDDMARIEIKKVMIEVQQNNRLVNDNEGRRFVNVVLIVLISGFAFMAFMLIIHILSNTA